MPDPVEEPQEFADKLVTRFRDEVIRYFEGRFAALEDSVMALRRSQAAKAFADYLNTVNEGLARAYHDVQDNPDRSGNWGDCHNLVQQHFRLVFENIANSNAPEEVGRLAAREWKNFFDQKRIPHPEI